jgi:cardiolipin synthase
MSTQFHLLTNGPEIRRELTSVIAHATDSLCLMMYIYGDDEAGQSLLTELIQAARRGVRVKMIVDAFGSLFTPDRFFAPLREAGGEIHWFNSGWHPRYLFRNHQKFVLADSRIAIIGGFNIANHYFGDGVQTGWRELGIRVEDSTVAELQSYFDSFMDALARKSVKLKDFAGVAARVRGPSKEVEWLVNSPGIGKSLYVNRLRRDLIRGSRLSLMMGYFVPTASLRRVIGRIARRGRVEIVLPQKTDVPISRYAAWSTFKRLLRDGCEIYEYQPQPLHAKLIVIDDVVYAGSANIDIRSLHFNYEISLRVHNAKLAAEARLLVQHNIALSTRITQEIYDRSSGVFRRLIQRASYILLSRFDYLVTRRFLD